MWDSWKAGYSCKELTPLETCKNTEQLRDQLVGTKNCSGYTHPQSESGNVLLVNDKLLSLLINGQITFTVFKIK